MLSNKLLIGVCGYTQPCACVCVSVPGSPHVIFSVTCLFVWMRSCLSVLVLEAGMLDGWTPVELPYSKANAPISVLPLLRLRSRSAQRVLLTPVSSPPLSHLRIHVIFPSLPSPSICLLFPANICSLRSSVPLCASLYFLPFFFYAVAVVPSKSLLFFATIANISGRM